MSHDEQDTAALIRSGRYFDEARRWYQTLYIGPISERSFFVVIAGLAAFIAVVGVISVIIFMPIVERPGLTIKTQFLDTDAPDVVRIRPRGAQLDVAMAEFLVSSYVSRRESYKIGSYAQNTAFIRAHSDQPTAAAYDAIYSTANPRSPVNVLGQRGQRVVTINSVSTSGGEPRQAVVKFSTELIGVGTSSKTQWTATLGYYYSPMQVTENAESISVEDPQFQVVNYAVSQTP